jgi:hypothetical protein
MVDVIKGKENLMHSFTQAKKITVLLLLYRDYDLCLTYGNFEDYFFFQDLCMTVIISLQRTNGKGM